MIQHRSRIVASIVLGIASVAWALSPGAITADACGTYVDGTCVVPPDPVIVDGPTGPVMADGLLATLVSEITISSVNGLRVINAAYPQQEVNGIPASPGASTDSLAVANAGYANDNSPDWGGCSDQDACNNVQVIRSVTGSWSPQGSFDAYGPMVFTALEPSQQMDRQYWLISMHAQVNSKDTNKTTLCILTTSAEIQAPSSPPAQIVDWKPGSPYPVGQGQQTSFSVGYTSNGVSIGLSSTWNTPEGQIEGKVYQPNNNMPNTGYVGAYEEKNGCKGAVEVRDGVMWATPYGENGDVDFKIAGNVWYQYSN